MGGQRKKSSLGAKMGKKKKKNRGKAKKAYNKNQFIDIICAQCKMCRIYGPIYCYDVAYKTDPEIFMSEVYTRLLRQKLWLDKNQVNSDSINIVQFREIFCYSGICGGGYKLSCHSALDCFNSFYDQIKGIKIRDNRKKYKGKEPIIFEPYPTFFISEDENFRKEIKEILSDGNRDIKQDSNKGSTVSAN